MKHSDEITFADCFKSIENVYRAIFSVAIMCRWIAEHNTVPTDAEAVQMEMEINRQVCDAWAEIYVTALREWLGGQ